MITLSLEARPDALNSSLEHLSRIVALWFSESAEPGHDAQQAQPARRCDARSQIAAKQ